MKQLYRTDKQDFIWSGEGYSPATLTEKEHIEGYGTLYNAHVCDMDIEIWECVDGVSFAQDDWQNINHYWTADGVTRAVEIDGRPYLGPFDANPNAMTTAEAEAFLGVTRARIQQLVDNGTIESATGSYGRLLLADDVIDYSLNRRGPGNPGK